jgi:hypothetical protein
MARREAKHGNSVFMPRIFPGPQHGEREEVRRLFSGAACIKVF